MLTSKFLACFIKSQQISLQCRPYNMLSFTILSVNICTLCLTNMIYELMGMIVHFAYSLPANHSTSSVQDRGFINLYGTLVWEGLQYMCCFYWLVSKETTLACGRVE